VITLVTGDQHNDGNAVPGSSKKMLEKSRGLNVDCIAYDLEDSVTPGKKAEARSNLRALMSQPRVQNVREQAVRINSVDSGLALDDLTEILKAPNLDALVIPKVNSASDLHFVTDVIRHALPQRHTPAASSISNDDNKAPLHLIALIESARAVMDLPSICRASPYLSGLIFAAEDFALDLSITRTASLTEFLYARSAIATAARAHSLDSTIDLVCTAYKGEQGLKTLEEECLQGKGMGFNGKQLIHPSQIEVCQRAFSPDDKEVEWAVRIVIADRKADQSGRGAWTLDGKMIDAPVVGKARAIVQKAELCGIDVESVKEKWKEQEPE
jgi:citrate lyase subunit beta-like protein